MTTQVAFLFPGQGSQSVGMGMDVYQQSSAAKEVFAAFDATLDFPLSQLCFNGPEETLRSTINAQPAIVAVSLAYLAAFQEALSPQSSSWSFPLVPSYTAGHSVGECAALAVAGALDLSGTAYLVRERGRLMHEEEVACPGGMVAVIGLDEQTLQEICQEATAQAKEAQQANDPAPRRDSGLSLSASPQFQHPGLGAVVIANYNAPGQIVLSGERSALEIASNMAKARGAKRVLPLSVSGAFHSPVMVPAVSQLAQSIVRADIHDATIPIVSNVTATPLVKAAELRKELAEQIASSVQWTRTIECLQSVGVTIFFEIGPGKALTGMIKRIIKGAVVINVGSMYEVEQAVKQVREHGLLS
jgi:[acyl-carrier-protein] S-malonyltransferase